MAERRMISKKIVDTDLFLDMPMSSRYLYYELNWRADDDGFVSSPKKITKMVGCSDDDLKLLMMKNFVIPFQSGVCVIKDWKIHNYIQKDRYQPTRYIAEKSQLITSDNKSYELAEDNLDTKCIQSVSNSDTQDRLELGKDRLEIESDEITGENSPCPYSEIQNLYSSICKSFPKLTKLSDARKKAIKARINSGYNLDDFKRLFEAAESSPFLKGQNNRNWQATFDWLIKDANMAKVLDGNYSDKPKQPASGKNPTYDIAAYEASGVFDDFDRK